MSEDVTEAITDYHKACAVLSLAKERRERARAEFEAADGDVVQAYRAVEDAKGRLLNAIDSTA